MLLTIVTTYNQAIDLDFLLHKDSVFFIDDIKLTWD